MLRLRPGPVRSALVICALIAAVYWLTAGGGQPASAGADVQAAKAAAPAVSPSQARAIAFRRLQSLPDTRTAECKALADEVSGGGGGDSEWRVSAVIYARLDKDSIVTQTVASLIAHTPPALLHEIIVVTAANAGAERVDALNYDLGAYGDIVKVATSDTLPADNSLRSRLLVAHLAGAPLVALFEDSVLVHRGWLRPLAAELRRHPDAVAVPVFDDFDATTLDFRKTDAVHAWQFDWDLSLAAARVHSGGGAVADGQQQQPLAAEHDSIVSPALTGHAFVARRAFIDAVVLARRPEANFAGPLDLSLLCWLCGGGVRIVPCARAARVGALRSVDPPPPKDAAALAARYLDREYLGLFSRLNGDSVDRLPSPAAADVQQLKGCKTFRWFLENPANDVYVPADDVRAYGWLVSYSGVMCFWHESSGRMTGTPDCQGSRDESAMVRLLTDGRLSVGADQCLGVDAEKYVVVTHCNSSDSQQLWTLLGSMQLQLTKFRSQCLMHATDPTDVDYRRQVLMAAPCAKHSSDDSKWQKWTKLKVLSS